MAYTLSLTQSQSLAALRTVLLGILPSGIECVQGEDNQIPEPVSPNFVIFWPILRTRLETNATSYQDCAFTGSVSGATLTVSSIGLGAINVGAQPTLYGPTVASGSQITAQLTGTPGGVGTYRVAPSQTVTSGPLAAGLVGMVAPTQLTIQTDIHGPSSADYAQVITTVFRSSYGVDQFAATGYDVTPLYCSDPRQMPWSNAENQIERVWSCDVVLQVNSIVWVPQQYFSALSVTVKPPVDLH